MKTLDDVMRNHLPQCFVEINGAYYHEESEIKISPDLIRKLMKEYAQEVQNEQKSISAIWGAALYHQRNHPSESLVVKFRSDMLESPCAMND